MPIWQGAIFEKNSCIFNRFNLRFIADPSSLERALEGVWDSEVVPMLKAAILIDAGLLTLIDDVDGLSSTAS